MRACLGFLVFAVSVGCNGFNGLDDLERADCVGDCSGGGSGGAGGSAGGAGGDEMSPQPIATFAMGRFRTCAHAANNDILCWGSALPGNRSSTRPIVIEEFAGTDRITSGPDYACFLLENQTFCFGQNERGQLGDGTRIAHWDPAPVNAPGGGMGTLDNVRRLTRGDDFVCAQTLDNDAVCWGANDHGQLGNGTTTDSLIPVQVVLPGKVNKVSGGAEFACAALVDSRVFCWGRNHRGQLGQTMVDDAPHPNAAEVDGVLAEKTFGGGSHMCAQTAMGTVSCWGAGDDGQLGHGVAEDSATPVDVVGVTSVAGVSPGNRHTCVLTSDGVRCWGANDFGQLFNDAAGPLSATPVVPGNGDTFDGMTATKIESGGEHVCGVSADGNYWCWGLNDGGQIGNGEIGGATAPVIIGRP